MFQKMKQWLKKLLNFKISFAVDKPFSFYKLLELYFIGIVKGEVTYRASAISFSFFLALFPFLLMVLNLIPYVPIQNFQLDFWFFIDDILPFGTHDFFKEIFFDIAQTKRAGLLSGVFALSLILTSNGIYAIFSGFEGSYHMQTTRSVVKSYLVAMSVALIMVFLLLFSVALLLFINMYVLDYLEDIDNLYKDFDLINALRKMYVLFIILLINSILFRFGSHDKGVKFFSAGAFFSVILIFLTTYFFGIYIENFANYNQLYGSVGTLIIFLLYIWLNSVIILLGFELNASLLKLKKMK